MKVHLLLGGKKAGILILCPLRLLSEVHIFMYYHKNYNANLKSKQVIVCYLL